MKSLLSNLCTIANNQLLRYMLITIASAGACKKTGVAPETVTKDNFPIEESTLVAHSPTMCSGEAPQRFPICDYPAILYSPTTAPADQTRECPVHL